MSEILYIVESSPKILELTENQATMLQSLGRELRGQREFYINDDDAQDSDDSDAEDVPQRESSVITCQSMGDNRFRVRVANAIGAVALPGTTLHIVPKIPISHFAHLAQYAKSDFRPGVDEVSVASLEMFWEVVATWCVDAVEKLFRNGLLTDYREFTDDLNLVRGRINVWPTTKNFLSGRLEANCRFEELNLDHPLNRVLRAAVHVVAAHPSINSDLQKRASRLDRAMEGIGPVLRSDLYVPLDLRTVRYKSAIDLSKRVLGLLGTNVHPGHEYGKTFLIPTPGIIEEGIRNILRLHLAGVDVKKCGRQIEGDVHFTINPDLVFANGLVTGDVKYKIAGNKWNRGDVQQAAMFATGFSAVAALIITFSKSPDVHDIYMQLGSLPLYRIVWDAHEDTEPSSAHHRLLNRVNTFLEENISAVAIA
jgi:5-methylcytosine-specific restriction enzyme subunit McrC